ncbi:FabD/lysophospholipase-like protein, partial [Metschnikowia bicuspidata var. bicuspidata NRRL YB-4993]
FDGDDYINENHIRAFAQALELDDLEDVEDVASSLSTGLSLPVMADEKSIQKEAQLLNQKKSFSASDPVSSKSGGLKPTKIVSKSDWFPTGAPGPQAKKDPKTSSAERFTSEFRVSSSYKVFRWPILFLIGSWVLFLCLLYTWIRAYVALLEYFFTWTGERKKLRDKLRLSKTYDEWVQNAKALDEFLGLDKWSENPKFSYYDHRTLLKTIQRLRLLRQKKDIPELMVFLQGCIRKNFAGIENRQLYSHRYFGTKRVVEKYIDEVVKSIDCVANASEAQVSTKTKRKFFRVVEKNYGKTALCLSGGACFAYTHFGLVKALLDNDLLPRIISGTSGGGLIAALTCTRTDDELQELLVPELARKITACEDPWWVWLPRWWKTGARFDAVSWARKSNFFTKGSMTFQEAYNTTGRQLNISTVPAEPHSPVILCNTVTSPNCIIWSSLLASSAVPGILNPVVLMMKDTKNQEAVPFSMGNKWRDGSLRTDIPVDALNTYYNVNFSIVSQVNPHISLFFYAPKGTVGKPVAIARRKTRRHKFASLRGGFFATASEHLLKLEIKKWLEIIKLLDLFPRWLAQDWLNVFLQRFTGTITIWPRNRFKDFLYILLDPSEAQMEEYLMKGQRSMFSRLLFVKHRLSIERAIERGRNATRTLSVSSNS